MRWKMGEGPRLDTRAMDREIAKMVQALVTHQDRTLREEVRRHVRIHGRAPEQVWLMEERSWRPKLGLPDALLVEGRSGTTDPPPGATVVELKGSGWPAIAGHQVTHTGQQATLVVWPDGSWDTAEDLRLSQEDRDAFDAHARHVLEMVQFLRSDWTPPKDPTRLLADIERYEGYLGEE